jgi:hypothetical protein
MSTKIIRPIFRGNGKDVLRKSIEKQHNYDQLILLMLPLLKLVIPEVMKLQDKKRKEKAHKNRKPRIIIRM